MKKVTAELHLFKRMLSDKELELKRDKQLDFLRRSLNWFSREALQISNLYKAQEKKSLITKRQYAAAKDEIQYLEEALKRSIN